MKSTVMISALLLGSLLAGPAWSHHAAEGIVSDEIWQMIDDNLQAVDSPHLDIDFTDIMGSMSVFDAGDGDLYLMTSVPAYPLDVDDCELALLEAEELAAQALLDANQIPSGNTDSGNASVAWFEVVKLTNCEIEILLFEPIGSGNSQTGENPGSGPADEIPGDNNAGDEQGGKRADEDPGDDPRKGG
jgi:hypothetical protein